MNNEQIGALIAIPTAIWIIGGCFLYAHYSEDVNKWNKKQSALIIFTSGPMIWAVMLLAILITLLSYLESPFMIVSKWFHRFYLYLGDRETKRVKCPYCDLEPLQSTIRRYGMCGLCHNHGKGYHIQKQQVLKK